MKVKETFQVTGRGLVIVLDGFLKDFRSGDMVTINGVDWTAYMERTSRNSNLVLPRATKLDIKPGDEVELKIVYNARELTLLKRIESLEIAIQDLISGQPSI